MNRTDIEYVLHCVKNARELISQDESEKAKGLLLSGELLLSEKLTSNKSDYAKCKEAYIDGYESGHNDTVESCFGWADEKSDEWLSEHFA